MVTTVHNLFTNREPYTVEYAYDHQGRMVWKQISANAVALSTRNLVWDNYNIIAETIQNPQSQTTNCYVWGLDLSGSLQGAGGVGGLLAVTTVSNPGTLEPLNPETFFPCFDANGNVTEYADESGNIEAHYEYDPFGNTVVQSGDMAQSFTHRFSTKPWCPVTGLSEYLFRKYSPGMGRWLSRDPMEEEGGINLLIFLENDPITSYDPLGEFCTNFEGNYGAGGLTLFIRASVCKNDCPLELEASLFIAAQYRPAWVDGVDRLVRRFGIHAELGMRGGVQGDAKWSECSGLQAVRICGRVEAYGGLEYRVHRYRHRNSWAMVRVGASLEGAAMLCANFCNGDVTLEGQVTGEAYAQFGSLTKWRRSWQVGFSASGELFRVNVPSVALLRDYCNKPAEPNSCCCKQKAM